MVSNYYSDILAVAAGLRMAGLLRLEELIN